MYIVHTQSSQHKPPFFPSSPKLKVPPVKSINFYSFRGPSEVDALYETQQENKESHFYSPFNFFFFTSLFWLTLRGSGCLAPTQLHRGAAAAAGSALRAAATLASARCFSAIFSHRCHRRLSLLPRVNAVHAPPSAAPVSSATSGAGWL